MYKTSANADLLIDTLHDTSVEKELPWKYTFIDPVYVEVSAGSLASFVTDKRYELVLPALPELLILLE